MAQFEIGRPNQEIRLRDWPAGRLAAMKLMVTRLEEGLNDSLAAAVKQSAKRKVNANVPIIIEFDINPGFRQFEVNFPIPPGLGGAGRGAVNRPDRQLLFYEIQHAATPGFIDPIIVETPQNHIIIGGVGLGETRFFRARVVNTRFEASPWTKTVQSTAAQGTITITDIDDVNTRLVDDFDTWETIFRKTYQPVDGAISLSAQIAVGATQTNSVAQNTYRSGPGHIQFRWTRDIVSDISGDVEFGDRAVISATPGFTGTKFGRGALAFGTFVSPFVRLGDEKTIFKLQAKKRPGSRWRGGEGSGNLRPADPMIFVRNAKILEVLEKF